MRLDCYLVSSGYAESRQKGRYLIDNMLVTVNGNVCTKASADVDGKEVVVTGEGLLFVGRGGLKLEGALNSFNIDVSGMTCADIGSSTGGFTDCLLRRGAARVFAVDSGRDQLHESLRQDSRVTVMEGFNAKELKMQSLGTLCDIAVMDLSFISQTLIHPNVADILKVNGIFVSLIKPQFEVGRLKIGKGGIVRDAKAKQSAIDKCVKSAESYGFSCANVIPSPIKGGDGNEEFIAYFIKKNNIGKETEV